MCVFTLTGWAQNRDSLAFRTWSQYAAAGERDVETLRINEICASNNTVWADESGQFPDWIELHNYGDDDINLNGRWLSDDPDNPFKHQIDENLWIASGGFILLYADNQTELGPTHLNFSLNAGGEHVFLSTADFVQIDAVAFGNLPSDMSWAYVTENNSFALFPAPTPSGPNFGANFLSVAAPPVYSYNNFFFSAPFDLTLSQPNGFAIHYTIDGENPDATATLYTGPILVESNVCVRSMASAPGYLDSPIETRCYAPEGEYTLDIVSVSAPEASFWGSGGIYSNPFSGLEKRAHVAQYAPDGSPKYEMDMGVRIHAPDARQQKSLRFYARSEYGNTQLNHPLFPDKDISQFKRFILRNAGNDGLEAAVSRTGLRDPLISWLYGSLDESYGYAAYEPVHVFLNGAYWGIYNMRERQDEHYIKSNYGYEADEIDFLERTAGTPDTRDVLAGTWADYDLMQQAAIDLDLSQEENYEIISDWMNIKNFTDYQLTEIFICNQDWLSNNMKFWKPHDNSRKWEWIIWDTDWGFGTFYPSYPHGLPTWNALNFALSDWGGWTNVVETHLLQNLIENSEFLEYFCTRAADLRNSYFLPERIIEKLHEYRDRLQPDIPKQFERWGSSMLTWLNKVDYIETFVTGRPEQFMQHITDRFDLGAVLPIHLEIQPPGSGYIEVNTIQTDADVWEGFYFEGIPVRLKAVPHPGHVFTGWSNDVFATEQYVNMTADLMLTAHFETLQLSGMPVINEINYHPSPTLNAGEWVEIRNNGPNALDLSLWTLEDENGSFTIPQGVVLASEDFLVICADTILFKSIYPDVNHYLGNFEFSLNNAGESVQLRTPSGQLVDAVTYDDAPPWPMTPDGAGPTLELISPDTDNMSGTNWFARPTIGGTPGAENSPFISIDSASDEISAVLFPNPVYGTAATVRLMLKVKKSSAVRVQMHDMLGRSFQPKNFDMHANQSRVVSGHELMGNIESLAAGIYLLEITAGDFRKCIKMHVAE